MEDEEQIGEGAEESDEDAEGNINLHAILFANDGEIEVERIEEEGDEAGVEEGAVPSVDESGFGIEDLIPPGDLLPEREGFWEMAS